MKRLLLASVFALFSSVALACPITEAMGEPQSNDHNSLISLCRIGYHSAYNPATLTTRWVAEHMLRENVDGPEDRTNQFANDPDLKRMRIPRPTLEDYVGATVSGEVIARGHMAPAGNFRRNDAAERQSYYIGTNIVPQIQRCNNSGLWAQVERITRDWAINYGELYVVTGTIYAEGTSVTIGKNRVAFPSHIFKVLYNPTLKQSLAFVIPNVPMCGVRPRNIATTQDEVEKMTGIRFFPNVTEPYERSDKLWP